MFDQEPVLPKSPSQYEAEVAQRVLRRWHEAVPNDRMAHLVKDATRALLRALQWLEGQAAAAATAVQVISDSRVLVEQLGPPAGTSTVEPIARLAPLLDEARTVLQRFAQVDLQWVPRHRNRAADALARAALGLAPKAALPAGQVQRGKRRRH